MKTKEFNEIVENIISSEIRKTILEQVEEGKKEVYHIKCNGQPIDTYDSNEEAQEHLDKYKKDYPGKQFIIEKGIYESDNDMIDKLDQMGEEIEENNTQDMKEPIKVKSLAEAILDAKNKGIKKIKIDEKSHNVNELWKRFEEEESIDVSMDEESDCMECGEKSMEEGKHHDWWNSLQPHEQGDYMDQYFPDNTFGALSTSNNEKKYMYDKIHNKEDDFKSKIDLGKSFEKFKSIDEDTSEEGNDLTGMYMSLRKNNPEFFNEESDCMECGEKSMEEGDDVKLEKGKKYKYKTPSYEDDVEFEDKFGYEKGEPMYKFKSQKGDTHLLGKQHIKQFVKEDGLCSKCDKKICECKNTMNESNKKTIRLSESQLVDMISKIVKESTKNDNSPFTKTVNTSKQNVESIHTYVPGISVTKDAQTISKKENDDNMNMVNKKMKDYLSFDGNDNPEYPHAIGKGDKVARENTKEQDEEVDKNFAGLQNLEYDIEPDEKFKDRLKKGIQGDSTMGNSPTTDKPTIKPSNGADKGEESKDKDGNVIPTPETAKKMEKQMKNRQEDKDKRVLYPKEKIPVASNRVVNEDIEKIKNLYSYNKKTQ
jgi:hypothetical protein